MQSIKSYTDINQSKKLTEILPLESADLWWDETEKYPRFVKHYHEYLSQSIPPIPCWSLAALLGALPYGYSSILTKSFDGKDYYCKIDGETFETDADNPVDACYELILKLHELKKL